MSAEPGQPPQHPSSTVALVMAALVLVVLAAPFAVAARGARQTRRALRFCPRCGGRAVRHVSCESLSPLRSLVTQQCGECATWRRVVVEPSDWQVHERRVERDRRAIQRRLDRLQQRAVQPVAQPPGAHSGP